MLIRTILLSRNRSSDCSEVAIGKLGVADISAFCGKIPIRGKSKGHADSIMERGLKYYLDISHIHAFCKEY